MEQRQLKEYVQCLYADGDGYVFMNTETYEQIEFLATTFKTN